MRSFDRYLINIKSTVREALARLDKLASDAILFLTDDSGRLIGSITDGDLRRGFIKGLGFEDELVLFAQSNPKFIQKENYSLREIIQLKQKHYLIFPVIDLDRKIIDVVNFRLQSSYLPIDALVMAGGRGERLRPLTDHLPKPLLRIGEKPIIEYNVERLSKFGVYNIWISIRYLGEQLVDYFGDGSSRSIKIKYIEEQHPLGTAGALALVDGLVHDYVLLMNSDLLTNIDFEDMFLFFEEHSADFVVACTTYNIDVPYAVMETQDKRVVGFKEKPTYAHYANAGIYLMKRELIKDIPVNQTYNATDLMEDAIKLGKRVFAYPLVGYWLDIGRHEDYKKAQEDIKQLKL